VSTPTPATVTLASWITDASLAARGQASLAISVAHWRSPAGRDIEAPVIDIAAGVTPRLEVGGNLPVYHYQDVDGALTSGVRHMRVYAKVGLLAPATHRVGLACSPVLQVQGSAATGSRVGWVLPFSGETRLGRTREYGSIGYSSGGAVFVTGAVEVPITDRLAASVTFGRSRATRIDASTADQPAARTDLSVTVARRMASSMAIYGAAGHAYSGDAAADGGVWLAGGLIVQFQRR
jgi:hypothetical protein